MSAGIDRAISFLYCILTEEIDEFHYILNCPYLNQYRDIYIKKRYTKRPNIINFRKSLKISKGKSESVNRQTTQWLKENEQKDKQRSTKHYTLNPGVVLI
jgi:hypothetical protein